MLRALIRGLQDVKGDREGALPWLMQYMGISREEAERAYDGQAFAYSDDGTVSERSLRYALEVEKQQYKITEEIPLARVANFGPLYAVLAEMGIQPAPGSAR